MEDKRRGDWSLLAGIGLVVLGIWLLGERLLGSAWAPLRRMVMFLGSIAWPLVIIVIGAALIVAARRGTLHVRGPRPGARLYRSRHDRMVSGVLAGLGDYLGIDPTWLRIGYVVLAISSSVFPAIVIYIIASIVIPEEPVGGASANQPVTAPAAPAPPAPYAPEPPAAPAAPAAPEPPASKE